jgi:hypothetical protein
MNTYDRVNELIGMTSYPGWYYTSTQIYNAINEAQEDMIVRTQWETTTATYTTTASADMITIPTTVMIPQRIVYGSQEWYPTSLVDLESYSRTWRTATAGQPKWFMLWDARHLRSWPKPDAAYALKIVGTPWPDEMSAVIPDVLGNDTYRSAVAYAAASILLEGNRPDMADVYTARAEEEIYAYGRKLRNQGPHRVWRMRPGTRFTAAQAGHIGIAKRGV